MSDDAFLTGDDIPTLRKLKDVFDDRFKAATDPMMRLTFHVAADICRAYIREIEGGRS